MRFIIKPIAWALITCLVNNPIYGFYVVTGLLFFKPFPAFAEAFIDSAAEGQNLGTDLMSGYSIPMVNSSTGEMTMTNGLANGQVVQRNELFQEIQPGSMDGIAASYGDSAALGTQVNNNLGSLGIGTSSHANAYQTLMGANTAMPNMYNDPMWQTSDDVYSLRSPLITDLFNGCEKQTNWSEKDCSIHMEDLKTCKKTMKTESCKVTRVVTKKPSAITKVSGDGSFTEVSTQEIVIELGNRDINSQGSGCPAVTWTMIINVTDPSQINSATITAAGADDNVKLEIDGNNVFQSGGCADRSGWQSGFNTDITGAFSTVGQHTIKLSVLTGGATHDGGGFLVMTIVKNANDMEQEFLDFPAGCRQRLFDNWPPTVTAPDFISNGSATDDASTKWWKCTEASDSKVIEGVTITPALYGNSLGPILPDAPPSPPAAICYAAETRVPGHISLECFIDKDGYQVCPEFDYNNDEHDACDQFADNPQCAYIGESCADGSANPITGTCARNLLSRMTAEPIILPNAIRSMRARKPSVTVLFAAWAENALIKRQSRTRILLLKFRS
jgi:conjugal transfer mating pair stabilization protein TraN